MTQEPARPEVLTVGDGDVVITFPTNMSRRCIEDLKAQLDMFIEKLLCPDQADREAFVRGLAELAAYDAARRQEGTAST
jgi:hypothetical protein